MKTPQVVILEVVQLYLDFNQEHILKSLASKLKSLASKPTSPWKCRVFGSRTALFFDWLKRKITKQKITKNSSFSIRFFSLFGKYRIMWLPSHSKPYFKWLCVKALIGEWGAKGSVESFFFSAYISGAGGANSKALKPSRAIARDSESRHKHFWVANAHSWPYLCQYELGKKVYVRDNEM